MTLAEQLTTRYLDRLLASARGRAFVLTQMAEAEGSDEGAIFDLLLERVDDPELHRLIRKHADDERRHAEMFREAAARTGAAVPAVPDELKLISRIDRALDGFFDRDIADPTGIMDAYLLLQVIEERAITQFRLIEPIMRRHDPHTADVMRSIAKDEERHLKYCHAISRRYAPDEITRMRTLRRYRDIEARAFTDNGAANMRHTLAQNLVAVRPLERLLWLGFSRLGPRRHDERTPFWDEAAAAA